MPALIARFRTCGRGTTAIEYGVLAGLLALGLITSFTSTKDSIQAVFTKIGTTMDGAVK
jgi:pilus assembly protein Flp/PilA